jgi:integrase
MRAALLAEPLGHALFGQRRARDQGDADKRSPVAPPRRGRLPRRCDSSVRSVAPNVSFCCVLRHNAPFSTRYRAPWISLKWPFRWPRIRRPNPLHFEPDPSECRVTTSATGGRKGVHNMASSGRIYERGGIYFVAYSIGGREFRESSRSRNVEDAQRLLSSRTVERSAPALATEAPPAVPPTAETSRFTFDDLAKLYLEEYEVRQFRGPKTAEQRVKNLRRFFAGMAANAINVTIVRQYQARRIRNGAAAATVNRETAALRRMCRLAASMGLLPTIPLFPESLPENPPRQGFFEHPEYLAVRKQLPAPYQDVLDFAYYSGWRRREITELTWEELDLAGGVIRLHPARSKTRRGRVLPISPALKEVLDRRAARRKKGDALVFRQDGVTERDWKKAWPDACRKAGVPGRRLHDCRRTAARNLIRAGVPERVAMMLLGHSTRHIFDRYNIVNERDLSEAGHRLLHYINAQPTSSAQ